METTKQIKAQEIQKGDRIAAWVPAVQPETMVVKSVRVYVDTVVVRWTHEKRPTTFTMNANVKVSR